MNVTAPMTGRDVTTVQHAVSAEILRADMSAVFGHIGRIRGVAAPLQYVAGGICCKRMSGRDHRAAGDSLWFGGHGLAARHRRDNKYADHGRSSDCVQLAGTFARGAQFSDWEGANYKVMTPQNACSSRTGPDAGLPGSEL